MSDMLDDDPDPLAGRRTIRDVSVDVLMVLAGAVIVILTALESRERGDTLVSPEAMVGAVGCLGLVWRRRWPVAIALVSTVLSGFTPMASGPAILALFSLAVHRPARSAVPVGVLGVGMAAVASRFAPDWGASLVVSALLTGLMLGWGTTVRNRRQLLVSLAELARNAEFSERERLQTARAGERALLAREMHDVLAHRMSLISIHAGAIEFRQDASREEVRQAAGVIRAGVHQMLVDLREVISMLRDDTDRDFAVPMTLAGTLPELFEESERAGSPVQITIAVGGDIDAVPGIVARAAYRVVQEGLTNARKHAGAVEITVTIEGGPGQGLSVEIRQPISLQAERHGAIPGSGSGLTGLAERVLLVGGTLEHAQVGRDFVLRARLPWERAS